jgi:hypothetical protein
MLSQPQAKEPRPTTSSRSLLDGQTAERSHPNYIAGIYSTLGERDQAFEWLEKAYQVRDYQLTPIMIDPVFDSIRSDPRYTDLLRRMGLPQ